jgi:hypothetical protein
MRHKVLKICSKCKKPAKLVTHRTICHLCNLGRKRAVAAKAQSTEAGAAYNRTTTAAYRRTARGRAGLLIWFAERRARAAVMEFSIDAQDITKRVATGVCEATGLPFDMAPGPDKHHANPWAPSLDRRDSSKGYTRDNVQVVCVAYNYAKSKWSTEVLLRLARAIVDANHKASV